MQPHLWYARWKKVSWLQRLCGVMPEPSMATRGAAEYIASLPLIPVRENPQPESDWAKKTTAGSGPTSRASSKSATLPWFSSKMCATTYDWDSAESRAIYAEWVTKLGRDYSALKRWAHRTDVSGCSRLPFATPKAISGGANSQREARGAGGADLQEHTAQCTTPCVPNGGRSSNDSNYRPDGSKQQIDHAIQARNWQSPQARDFRSGEITQETAAKHNGSRPLNEEVLNWPRSGAEDAKAPKTFSRGNPSLTTATQNWQGPTTFRRFGLAITNAGPFNLKRHLGSGLRWADSTCSVISYDALVYSRWASRSSLRLKVDRSKMKLEWQRSDARYVRPSRTRKLNVYFDEQLQGWPVNWSSAEKELTGFDQWERESHRLLWHLLSSYSARPTESTSEDQLSLFEGRA